MGKCITCGNEYDQSFDIHKKKEVYTFDSFECAITKLAPECKNCRQKILGHGVQIDDTIYCCAHCARQMGQNEVYDRAQTAG